MSIHDPEPVALTPQVRLGRSHKYSSGEGRLSGAISDFHEGLLRWRAWLYLAWMEIMRAKRRAWLGAVWYPLTLGVTVWVVGPLFGMMRGYDLSVYVPYFAVGMAAYQIATSFLTGSGRAFIGGADLITNSALPYSFFLFRFAANQVILSLLYLPVILTPFVILQPDLSPNWLGLMWGIVCFYAVLIALSFSLAVFFTRFRDVIMLLKASTRFMFLVTPIIWFVDDLTVEGGEELSGRNLIRAMFVDANPFYHVIELVRAPALGEPMAEHTAIYVGAMFLVAVIGFFTIFTLFRRRIVYWL